MSKVRTDTIFDIASLQQSMRIHQSWVELVATVGSWVFLGHVWQNGKIRKVVCGAHAEQFSKKWLRRGPVTVFPFPFPTRHERRLPRATRTERARRPHVKSTVPFILRSKQQLERGNPWVPRTQCFHPHFLSTKRASLGFARWEVLCVTHHCHYMAGVWKESYLIFNTLWLLNLLMNPTSNLKVLKNYAMISAKRQGIHYT